MLSIRRVIRVSGAAVLLVSGVAVGVLSSSPIASASELAWSIVTSPSLPPGQAQGNQLNAVSCNGPSACVAVGDYATPDSFPPLTQTLIESWNGSAWSIVPSPNTSSTQDNQLNAVSCSGASACVAVGTQSSSSTGQQQTLIESWNGSVWSIVPSPNTSPTQDNLLSGVSCTGPSACVATGGGGTTRSAQQTLIESWNGSVWSIVPSPNTSPTQVNVIDEVSCTGPTACVTVGSYYPSADLSQTLIESWNGSVWSIVPSPNTSPTEVNVLLGVSCTSASACTAMGFYNPSNGFDQTLIESWNGSDWSIVTSPNTSPTQNNYLSGVSCTSPAACTAVGFQSTASTEQTLIESWNGSAWSIVPSPNTSPSEVNLLLGVSCSSSSACTAVGSYDGFGTLVERGTLSTTTSVLIPSSGAILSGSTYLDASASNATSVQFLLFGGTYGYSAPVVCTATATAYGWLCSWNTTTVPNGSYVLVSEASGAGGTGYSSGVSIMVNNASAPTTSVLLPSSGATLSGSTYLDASASNATSVEFLLFGGTYGYSAPVVCTGTATQYGWLCSWNTTTVPNGSYVLVSEASGPGGSAFSSTGVSITVKN